VFGLVVFIFTGNIKYDDGNVFGWISIFIFSENIFPNELKTGNNKISFSVFSVETKNFILGKMKTR